MRNIIRMTLTAMTTIDPTTTSTILWAAALLSTYENIGKNYHPQSRMAEWADRWHHLYAAYNEETEPEHWDERKTFLGDEKLFIDSPEHDDIIEDLFHQAQTKTLKFSKIGGKVISKPQKTNLEQEAITRLKRAVPVTFRDMPFENQTDLRTMGELPPSEAFNPMTEKLERRVPVRYGQLNRLIVEDCTMSSTNDISIPQLTRAGDCNIPAHLRLDGILKFSQMINTYEDAQTMSRIIKALDLPFKEWVQHNIISKKEIIDPETGEKKKIKIRKPLSQRVNTWAKEKKQMPWLAPLGKDRIALYEIAEELYVMSQEEQEDPAWAKDMEPDPLARYFNADFTPPEPGLELDSESTTGEYTYWRVTMIPEAKWFDTKWSSIKIPDFKYALNHIDKMSVEQMQRIKELLNDKKVKHGKRIVTQRGRGNYAQRDKWNQEMRRELNKRAKKAHNCRITILPPQLEPIETDDDISRLYERMDDWQFDEAGHKYMSHEDDPSEDILDDGFNEERYSA